MVSPQQCRGTGAARAISGGRQVARTKDTDEAKKILGQKTILYNRKASGLPDVLEKTHQLYLEPVA